MMRTVMNKKASLNYGQQNSINFTSLGIGAHSKSLYRSVKRNVLCEFANTNVTRTSHCNPAVTTNQEEEDEITGFSVSDISMYYNEALYLPYLTDYGTGGTSTTYRVTNSSSGEDSIIINDFVNMDLAGQYTITATKNGGDDYNDISVTAKITLNTDISIEEILQSATSPIHGYISIAEIYTDDSNRYLLTNYWPSFNLLERSDNNDVNTPKPRGIDKKLVSLKLPKTPSYPSKENTYNYFEMELADSSEVEYTYIHDVPQQFTVTGVLGQMTTQNVHWSKTNKPSEILVLDPLPAACGGKKFSATDYEISEGNASEDTMTGTSAGNEWDTSWVIPTYGENTHANSFELYDTDPDNENAIYKPGYYFRYFIDAVQEWTLIMDEYGGHTQPDGDWHIHIGTFFANTDYKNCVIGYAVDGTPIIGAGSDVSDISGNPLGISESSYRRRLKDSEYTDPSSRYGNGFYIYDYMYEKTSKSTLDEFNGGYIILDNNLTYAYFITEKYPIWPRNIRGKVENIKYTMYSDAIAYTVSNVQSQSVYNFTDENGAVESSPTLQKGKTYVFNRLASGPSNPFNFGDEWISNTTGIPAISTGTQPEVNNINSIGNNESILIKIPPDYSGILKYYSYTDQTMIGEFTIVE